MNTSSRIKTKDMVNIALFTVLIVICSWISIPTVVPFTLQTFAVFFSCLVLGGKYGTCSVFIYLLLGALGLPVFSNFTGGIGALLGPTGGYLAGFLLSALMMWIMENLFGRKRWVFIVSMILGLLVCYAFGTAWFFFVYTLASKAITFKKILGLCVLPFIIPDLLKISLALILSKRFSHIIR